MQKVKRKNNKGITLIALIITIIVMIILVAVTVNVAINGGLFGTASTASQRTERDALYDQIVGAMKLTGEGKIDKTGTYNAVEEILEGQGRTVEPLQEDGTFEVIGTRGTYTYKITEEEIIKGEITGEGSGVGPESGNGGTVVPNPGEGNGSEGSDSGSEGSGENNQGQPQETILVMSTVEYEDLTENLKNGVDTGKVSQVIKEEKKNKETGEVLETLIAVVPTGFTVSTTEGENTISGGLVVRDVSNNEFVWIPVPEINDMIMCQNAEIIPEGAEEGTTGRCTIALQGETLKCTKHNSEALAGRLYAITTGNEFNTNLTGKRYEHILEPYNLSNYDHDTQDEFTQYGGGTYSNTMYQTEFNEMATSVAKNEGFYVGRYETGGFNETKVVSKPDRGMSGAGDINGTTWYKMYRMQKEFGNDIVGSSMIWGCQYDQVMKFVDGKLDGEGKIFSVTTSDSNRHAGRGGEETGTGNTPADFVANIYDLEGNMYDWTLEAYGTFARVTRGGLFNNTDSASYRGNQEPHCAGYYGSRLTLYVK